MTKARQLADLGNAYDDGALSNRNLIINGAMQVAQRGTSATGIGAASGYFTCDRWGIGSTTSGRLTMTQDSDAPSGLGSSLKLDCTTADTSIGSTEKLTLRHLIEGQNLQQFAKGTSDAKEFTVSFYVKGNASATYTCELYDSANVRQISKTFSVTTAWTKVVLTYPSDTTGAFNNDNGTALYLQIFLYAGSDFTSGTLNSTSWASDTKANRVSSGGTSFFDSTSRTFQITGVQLEVGDTATPFEHRSFGDELAKCQRYFETRDFHQMVFARGNTSGTGDVNTYLPFLVKKRAVPSVSQISGDSNIVLVPLKLEGTRAVQTPGVAAGDVRTLNCLIHVDAEL